LNTLAAVHCSESGIGNRVPTIFGVDNQIRKRSPGCLSHSNFHLFPGLAKPPGDRIGQFGGRIKQFGYGILAVLPGPAGPLAVIFGMVIIVLNPMVQQFHEFIGERERFARMGVTVMVVMAVMMAVVVVMMVVIVGVFVVMVVRHG
jgi:hypothetical protein